MKVYTITKSATKFSATGEQQPITTERPVGHKSFASALDELKKMPEDENAVYNLTIIRLDENGKPRLNETTTIAPLEIND